MIVNIVPLNSKGTTDIIKVQSDTIESQEDEGRSKASLFVVAYESEDLVLSPIEEEPVESQSQQNRVECFTYDEMSPSQKSSESQTNSMMLSIIPIG